MQRRKLLAAAAAAIALLATAPRHAKHVTGTFDLGLPKGPFISGSRLDLSNVTVASPVSYSLFGPGTLDGNHFVAPVVNRTTETTLIGAIRGALAYRTLDIVPGPAANRALLAVATYENGVALHDARTFKLIGYAAIGGPPGDVAFDAAGNLFAPDTDGTLLTQFSRSPWSARAIDGIAAGNEVAVDSRSGAVFVSDRDVKGKGALTRLARDGSVTRVITGDTAEGLAVDSGRGVVYVGNVNDSSVAEVDARSMKVLRKIRSVDRTFGIALDAKARRLFVVSNNSPGMRKGGGYVAAIDLSKPKAPIVARSANLTFPLGAALDKTSGRLFVTDEAADRVYVLNSHTLRPVHAPLPTCRTPWRPLISDGRLYVPCARANRVDVYDLKSLKRAAGAPFATGGFPLGVAAWH
jgi:DNA-binding beta-propeller fold protein YncE